MKLFEKIVGSLIITVMILNLIFLMPFSSLVITILNLILTIVYFGFSFALLNNIRLRHVFNKKSYNGISALRMIGVVLTGIVLSMTTIYILFVFQRWPYGKDGLIISLIWLFVIIAIVIVKVLLKKEKFYEGFLLRLIVILVIGCFFYLLPSEKLLEIRYRNYPNYVEAEKEAMQNP